MVSEMSMTIVKWISLPVLLTGSLFARFAGNYEIVLNLLVCAGALVVVERAVSFREYLWAAAFVGVAIVFSPLTLIIKIFLLLSLTCIGGSGRCIRGLEAATIGVAVRMRLALALAAALPFAAMSHVPGTDPLSWNGKLKYHGESTYSPMAIVGFAAYAGVLQTLDAPTEWGKGGAGYAKRFASTAAWSGIHSALAFGLDTALHQDPRYYRSGAGGWRRVGHSLRGTILTRTDTGGETLSTWRLGSAYGAAFLSNQWYPDRLNTVRLGMLQGSMTLGFDFVANLGREFWPDIKRKFFGKK